MKTFNVGIGALCASLLGGSALAQQLDLKLLPTGAMKKIGFYIPQKLKLSAEKPKGIHSPAGLQAPLYGKLPFGGRQFPVIVDQAADKTITIYLDASGKGNFGADSKLALTKRGGKGPDGQEHVVYVGDGKLNLHGEHYGIGVYAFDRTDPMRAALKDSMLYYPDYAEVGSLTLGATKYDVVLADTKTSGEFKPGAPTTQGGPPGLLLLIDRHDGNMGIQADQFDASKPFNLGGTTYELDFAKSKIGVKPSATTVAEVPLPVGKGDKAIVFNAKTTGGRAVAFPGDYKGKVVLLDFWATWCGPCMAEAPNVVAAYNKFHGKGFEILGISLDNAQTATKVADVTQKAGMTWDQVCDGKFWQAEVAQLYGVQAIPQAYLVDGDTGVILAEGEAIRGDALGVAIDKALASKSH